MKAKRIRVLIADDHPIVRRGLKEIVAETDEVVVAGEAGSARELRDMLRGAKFDVAVVDFSMPGSDGLDLIEDLGRRWPGMPVLVLSVHPAETYALQVLRAGAAGYLTKDEAAATLVDAIRKVAGGGRYVTGGVAERLAEAVADRKSRPVEETLSKREFQVLRLLAQGMSVKAVAEALGLSDKTVSTYRARLLDKTGLGSTAELIRFAIRRGLAD